MQHTEHYEIRVRHADDHTETITLPEGAAEHQGWDAYGPIRAGLTPGQQVQLVRVSEVVLAQSAKADDPN